MTSYLFGRFGNYKGPYGSASKASVMDLGAASIDQQMFPFDQTHLRSAAEGASNYMTSRQLDGNMKRDLAMDVKNPRQELPKNPNDLSNIDEIPFWAPEMIMINMKMDYSAHDQVRLLQDATQNFLKQENLFTDEKLVGKDQYNTDKVGKTMTGISQAQMYSFGGSAAGRVSDRLYDDGDYTLNSVTSESAF